MVERKMDKWWFCQASLNFADDEQVPRWAGRAGCQMVFLGMEAEEEDAQAQVTKTLNSLGGAQVVHTCNRRMYAWPVLWRRALRTLWQTRSPLAAMFARQSNLNYRNVAWSG
jgi:hypothetical protein